MSRFSVDFFCLTVPKISVGESFTVAIISGIEKVWIRGGGVSRFSVENFLSHSAENFRRGIFYCCNNFGYRKSLDKRGGGASRFSVENFLSHSAEKFHGLPFNVSENLGHRKILCIIGGIISFRRKFFVSQCRKTS